MLKFCRVPNDVAKSAPLVTNVARGVCAVALALFSCVRLADAFTCTSDAQCVEGARTGTCEVGGACAFPDNACPSGKRFAEHAGERSGQCVASTDAGPRADAGEGDVRSCDAPGLVAYYKFDEGSGSLAANCVGAQSYAGQVDGATWSTPIEGLSALAFDGGDRVDLGSSASLLEDAVTRSFTITASVVAGPKTLTQSGRIVSKCPVSCAEGLELLIEERGADAGVAPGLALRVPTVGTLSQKVQDPAPFPVDTIVRVAGIYDATGVPIGRVYRDGDKVAERALTGTRRNIGGSIAIGMKADIGGEGFVGTIDEVRLWNRVLSDCEIRTLAGKPCNEN